MWVEYKPQPHLDSFLLLLLLLLLIFFFSFSVHSLEAIQLFWNFYTNWMFFFFFISSLSLEIIFSGETFSVTFMLMHHTEGCIALSLTPFRPERLPCKRRKWMPDDSNHCLQVTHLQNTLMVMWSLTCSFQMQYEDIALKSLSPNFILLCFFLLTYTPLHVPSKSIRVQNKYEEFKQKNTNI